MGEWGRKEIAILGTSCSIITAFANRLAEYLSPIAKLGYADADHHTGNTTISTCAGIHFTDKISHKSIDMGGTLSPWQKHQLFNDCDLVLVNGNHFTALQQIVVIDPTKSLEAKLDRLTDVQLVLLSDNAAVPEYLLPIIGNAPQLSLDDSKGIAAFFEAYRLQRRPAINGLILSGGKSLRMGIDKGALNYHGTSQREHVYQLLEPFCKEVYISCNASQAGEIGLPKIQDTFLNLGPMSGILSAFQSAPDRAWLTVACDLPYISNITLQYLVDHRVPSKLATAFMDSEGKFPEPLITIWEPKAYPILLQALSEGYSCPRKVLINSDVAILQAPYAQELHNVNDPDAYKEAIARIQTASEAPETLIK